MTNSTLGGILYLCRMERTIMLKVKGAKVCQFEGGGCSGERSCQWGIGEGILSAKDEECEKVWEREGAWCYFWNYFE
jgi:hypothetical protein